MTLRHKLISLAVCFIPIIVLAAADPTWYANSAEEHQDSLPYQGDIVNWEAIAVVESILFSVMGVLGGSLIYLWLKSSRMEVILAQLEVRVNEQHSALARIESKLQDIGNEVHQVANRLSKLEGKIESSS